MATNKKPGWVTAVGIIAIVLSGFGVLGGLQETMSPIMIEAQRAEYETFMQEYNAIIEEGEQNLPEDEKQILEMLKYFMSFFEKMLNMPDWYLTWLVYSGILSMLINGFYLMAAIWLMQLKPAAPKYLAIALPFSIALGITRTAVAVQAFDSLAYFTMGGTMIAVVIEVILLFVLLSSDKSAFKQFEA